MSRRVFGSGHLAGVTSRSALYVNPKTAMFMNMVGFRAFATLPPHTPITMPALSPTMTEGGLTRWVKKEGDVIKAGDVLCEIETDKATVDFEMQEDGVLGKILMKEGTPGIKVGTLIGILAEDAKGAAALKSVTSFPELEAQKSASVSVDEKAQKKQAPEEKQKPSPASLQNNNSSTKSQSGRVAASPLARRLATELNVDLSALIGTGPAGRIIAADVKEAPASSSNAKNQLPASTSRTTEISTSDDWSMNKIQAPHFYLDVDIDVTRVLAMREELNADRVKSKVPPISFNDFVLRAVGLSMLRVPEANAAWGSDVIRVYDSCDVAVSADGNRFPVIKSVQTSGLDAIARQSWAIPPASAGEVTEGYAGTFSLVNVGAYGLRSIVPIVHPGNSTALGVGSIRSVINVDGNNDALLASKVATFTLSCDHRVVDGAVGAQWLQIFKSLLEKPNSMLL